MKIKPTFLPTSLSKNKSHILSFKIIQTCANFRSRQKVNMEKSYSFVSAEKNEPCTTSKAEFG